MEMKSSQVIAFMMVGGCAVVMPRPNDTSTSENTTVAPQKEMVALSDLERDVATALSGPPGEAALASLAKSRGELLRRRETIIRVLIANAEEKARRQAPSVPEASRRPSRLPYDPLGKAGEGLLRRIHHERAKMYFDQSKDVEALGELMPIVERDQLGGPRVPPLLSCGEGELSCIDARARMLTRWPTICASTNGLAECATDGEYQVGVAVGSTPLPRVVQFVVSKGAARGSNVTIVGEDFNPSDARICNGRFETDKILDVDERRILVERTTWCKSITKGRVRGRKLIYQFASLPIDLTPGALVSVLIDRGALSVRSAGEVDVVTVRNPSLIATSSSKGESFRWNERLPSSLLQYPVNHWLESSRIGVP
jgi:hypothetical protein